MKTFLFFLTFFSLNYTMDRSPQLLLAFEEDNSEPKITLSDFDSLKNRAGRLCKMLPKNISSEITPNILRIHSEGETQKLDCRSIDTVVRLECSLAANIFLSVSASNSILSTSTAQEYYDKARTHYQNALLHVIEAFKLKCYDSMEKLYQVLSAFIEAEIEATHKHSKRALDPKTQKLYHPLEKIIRRTEEASQDRPPTSLIPTDNTKDLLKALGSPKDSSLKNGYTYLKAGRTLLENLQDPTLESLNSIEITFFQALEHFISAYYRDINQGLQEAETALAELEKAHNIKKERFPKERSGPRYNLAKLKLESARKMSVGLINEDQSSEYSLERFLQEDATQEKLAPSSEDVSKAATADKRKATIPLPLDSARSHESKLHESTRAVKEDFSDSESSSKTTPLSLLKSAWKYGKRAGKGVAHGAKSLWNKLPFN